MDNWLHGYLGVNFADMVLYQAKDGGEVGTVMFELDDVDEQELIDGTLQGVRGHSMDARGAAVVPMPFLMLLESMA